jgi:magnesium transporter
MTPGSPKNRFFHIQPDGEAILLPDLPSAVTAMSGSGYIWLNFIEPYRENLEPLAGPFGLHPLAIEDCLDIMQIPKIENYAANTFILFNSISYVSGELFIDEVDLFLGKNYIIFVSRGLHYEGNFLDRLEQRAAVNRGEILKGPDYLLHMILDFIVDHKFHTIEALQTELDEIEDEILADKAAFRPNNLMRLRRSLLSIRKSITHEREILVKICRGDSPFIAEKSIYQFRDVYDHITKFFEETEIYRELISSFMEMYLSMMNNRMSMLANRTNLSVRRLTLITTIFMPLTLLAGIGGMSEWTAITGKDNWHISYPLFCLLLFIIGVSNYIMLKYLESKDKGTKK